MFPAGQFTFDGADGVVTETQRLLRLTSRARALPNANRPQSVPDMLVDRCPNNWAFETNLKQLPRSLVGQKELADFSEDTNYSSGYETGHPSPVS